MKIGILGGTFDPVHLGHLTIADTALQQLGLNRVLFLPAGRPWLKADKSIAPAVHRKTMIELAIADHPAFELSAIELERKGATYTAETLVVMRSTMKKNAEIFFLLGWDSLAQLPQWKRPAEIVKMCRLVAFTRSRMSSPDLQALEQEVPGVARSTIMLDIPPIDISSSEIRDRVSRGLPIKDMVPAGVEEYIKVHRLYTGM
jgi:nicotinate-nucleotide adenylyltransferase